MPHPQATRVELKLSLELKRVFVRESKKRGKPLNETILALACDELGVRCEVPRKLGGRPLKS